MKDLFKRIILDFNEFKIPKPTPRELELPNLPNNVRKALVFIGMRRSGKTWTMYQRMQELMRHGIPQSKILFINFEDDRLEDVTGKDLQYLLDAYFELYPEYTESKDLHFFFDEIHEVDGWEKFIRRLLDTETMQIYLSGSSAKMLSKEIATSLRGRTIVREVFPYNFREFLIQKKIKNSAYSSTKQQAKLVSEVQHFLRWGGFPETVGANPSLHRELLQGYIDSVIYRDIIERHSVSNSLALKRLLTHCLQNASSLFSINKVYNTLKSQGYAVSKDSLYQFMNYFEDAYCIFPLTLFHPSEKKSSLHPKKIYPVDQGLLTAYGWHEEFRHGSRLEAAVFAHFKRSGNQCFYYHTHAKREIDFLIIKPNNAIGLYQVSLSLKNLDTKERELKALREGMKELKINEGAIITLDEKKTFDFPEGKIFCIPSWEFLCGWKG